MTYTETRAFAERLRKEGYSYNMIAEKTGVSKSTLSDWLSTMPYTPNEEVKRRVKNGPLAAAVTKRRRKLEMINKAKIKAEEKIGTISERDLFMLGLATYIGEGEKNSGIIRVTNSNPKVIKLAINWLGVCCGVRKDQLRLILHLYPDNNEKKCKYYWSRETGIPIKQFCKTQIDRRSGKVLAKKGKLQYGTAHMHVRIGEAKWGTLALIRAQIFAWMDNVLEKASAGIV